MQLERWGLGVFLCAGASAGVACARPGVVGEGGVEHQRFEYQEYEVDIGSAERSTLLTGSLLGHDVVDLAVVHIDEHERRVLRLLSFEVDTWVPCLEATLGSGVLFVDVASIGGVDRLVSYEPGRLSWFDPESASERELVKVTCSFVPPRKNEVPHVDVTRDLNGDDRDDLVVPDADGFWVLLQREGGVFAEPVKVGATVDLQRITGADGYRYDPWSQSRVHEFDFDHDGRVDLVHWKEDHFEVHVQGRLGLFAPVARSFRAGVGFDSDQVSVLAGGKVAGRVLHSFGDLNGDGVADMVVYELEGTRVARKRSSYQVHFGAQAPGAGTTFAPNVDVVFQSDGRVALEMQRHDFDGDGRVDVMLTSIDIEFLEGSLWKEIKGYMGDDVWLEIELYRSEAGGFSDEPCFTRRLALDGVPSHQEPGWVPLEVVLAGGRHESRTTRTTYPRAFNTMLCVGDVTGDGRSDLLMADHPRIMTVFVGAPGGGLLSPRHQEVVAAIPNDEEYIWLVDVDRDGKQDVLMHRPFTERDGHGARKLPPGTEPHRVTILVGR